MCNCELKANPKAELRGSQDPEAFKLPRCKNLDPILQTNQKPNDSNDGILDIMVVNVSSEVWILQSTRCVEICKMHGIL